MRAMPTAQSGGVPIRYEVIGQGQPIVLVHGFSSSFDGQWRLSGWVDFLVGEGRQVIGLDCRGHGNSAKPLSPEAYAGNQFPDDVLAVMDAVGIERADIMGYSMGARITAFLALRHPERVRSAMLGGLGSHLVEGVGLPLGIADAMEAPSADTLQDPMQRVFRLFAEQTKSDLKALAACIRGSRQVLSRDEVGRIAVPILVSVGTKDPIAGSPHDLAALMPNARALDIPGRDHNLAVGDKTHKHGVLAFLAERP